ncbi:MAG: hypothetical protein ACLQVL_02280 [Terriglobia bacterium]
MPRSILAVLAGVLTMGMLSAAASKAMQHFAAGAFSATAFSSTSGFSPAAPVWWLIIAYTTVAAGLGGWITALVSRRNDLRDVFILAGLEFVMGVAGAALLFDWRLLWFYCVLLVFITAAIVTGGWLRTRRAKSSYT